MHKDTEALIRAAIVSAEANGDLKEAAGLMTIIGVDSNPVLSAMFYQFVNTLAKRVINAMDQAKAKEN